MRKTFSIMLVAAMIATLAACGTEATTTNEPVKDHEVQTKAPESTTSTEKEQGTTVPNETKTENTVPADNNAGNVNNNETAAPTTAPVQSPEKTESTNTQQETTESTDKPQENTADVTAPADTSSTEGGENEEKTDKAESSEPSDLVPKPERSGATLTAPDVSAVATGDLNEVEQILYNAIKNGNNLASRYQKYDYNWETDEVVLLPGYYYEIDPNVTDYLAKKIETTLEEQRVYYGQFGDSFLTVYASDDVVRSEILKLAEEYFNLCETKRARAVEDTILGYVGPDYYIFYYNYAEWDENNNTINIECKIAEERDPDSFVYMIGTEYEYTMIHDAESEAFMKWLYAYSDACREKQNQRAKEAREKQALDLIAEGKLFFITNEERSSGGEFYSATCYCIDNNKEELTDNDIYRSKSLSLYSWEYSDEVIEAILQYAEKCKPLIDAKIEAKTKQEFEKLVQQGMNYYETYNDGSSLSYIFRDSKNRDYRVTINLIHTYSDEFYNMVQAYYDKCRTDEEEARRKVEEEEATYKQAVLDKYAKFDITGVVMADTQYSNKEYYMFCDVADVASIFDKMYAAGYHVFDFWYDWELKIEPYGEIEVIYIDFTNKSNNRDSHEICFYDFENDRPVDKKLVQNEIRRYDD